MTSLIQLSAGTLAAALLSRHAGPLSLTLILALTVFTLNISVLHLGRPAYAWRALKMWRRSWLSREVLLFGLFFVALTALTAAAWLKPPIIAVRCNHPPGPQLLAPALGIAGILASAALSRSRPPRMEHPSHADRLSPQLAVLGCSAMPLLIRVTGKLYALPQLQSLALPRSSTNFPLWPLVVASALWMFNHIVRTIRLHRSG